MTKLDIKELNQQFETAKLEEVLKFCVETFGSSLTFASSLGLEDQVITHALCQLTKTPDIFVLDTGRLHQDTYNTMDETQNYFQFKYRVFYPDTAQVQTLVREKGINSFYDSIENRKECCFVRKVEPLNRALEGYEAWVTGQRRAQSVTRAHIQLFEEDNGRIKVNPLVAWNETKVLFYIQEHNIITNPLHDQGYPSIGCAPCTRAIKPGEDNRDGRWWWEEPENKECGLHWVDGKLTRKNNG